MSTLYRQLCVAMSKVGHFERLWILTKNLTRRTYVSVIYKITGIFSKKYKLSIFWNWLIVKIILILQKYFFWGYSKWRQIRVLQTWTEVCHQTFGDWEVQTMWNLHRYVDVYGEVYLHLTHYLSSKEKVLGAAVNKEGHADSVLGQERTQSVFISLKKGQL